MTAFDSLHSLQWGKMPIPPAFTSPLCQWGLWQYILLCVYVLGVEAVFNFPICMYKHSGLFLVAYYGLMILFSAPLLYVPMKIGSVFQRHICELYGNCIPILKGLPWAVIALSSVVCVYQSIYIMYSFRYMMLSFCFDYPWASKYNYTGDNVDGSYYAGKNNAESYFYNVFLDLSASYSRPGSLCLSSVVSLLIVWTVVFLLTCRGPKWFGFLTVGTSVMTVCSMLYIFIYSVVILPDAENALSIFIDKERTVSDELQTNGGVLDTILSTSLSSSWTWTKALKQNIFNLGLWTAILPALGCYIGDRKTVAKIAPVILLVVHGFLPLIITTIAAAFANGLAKTTHQPLSDVMQVAGNGIGLWFVMVPEAIAKMDVSNYWAVVLFFMLFLCTLHQQILLFLVTIENFRVAWPKEICVIFRRQEYFVASACALGFFLGLPMVTQGGIYVLHVVQLFLQRGLFVIVLLSSVPVAYIYVKLDPIYTSLERKSVAVWYLVASLAVSIILMYEDNQITSATISYLRLSNGEYVLGAFVAILPLLLCLVIGAVYSVYIQTHGTMKQRIKQVVTPSMISIYPPVVPPDQNELDIAFNVKIIPRLKTKNRYSTKKNDKKSQPAQVSHKVINTELRINSERKGDKV